jgi:hypothetical protein
MLSFHELMIISKYILNDFDLVNLLKVNHKCKDLNYVYSLPFKPSFGNFPNLVVSTSLQTEYFEFSNYRELRLYINPILYDDGYEIIKPYFINLKIIGTKAFMTFDKSILSTNSYFYKNKLLSVSILV